MKHNPKFLALVEAIRPQIAETNAFEVHQAFQQNNADFLLIDVREESEWANGHLPHALYLGRGIIERDIENHVQDPQTPLVLYCGGGFRSLLVAEQLQKMGYANIKSMDGGFRAWKDAGFEIE